MSRFYIFYAIYSLCRILCILCRILYILYSLLHYRTAPYIPWPIGTPFPLIPAVEAMNWQSRNAEFIRNVKYFLWKWGEKWKMFLSFFPPFFNFSQGFGKPPKTSELSKIWKAKNTWEWKENWKRGGSKDPRQTLLFMANKSISVCAEYTAIERKMCPARKEGRTIGPEAPGSSSQLSPFSHST